MRLFCLFLTATVLTGCIYGKVYWKEDKPYRDIEAYKKGTWILLAESKTKNWYYDPTTLSMEDGNIVSFTSFWAPNSDAKPTLIKGIYPASLTSKDEDADAIQKAEFSKEFNTGAIGPYMQKIDCAGHNYLSESLGSQVCDLSGNEGNPPANLKPGAPECWTPIKPKSAMLYIAGRVCGRPLPLERATNYFLYQEGRIPLPPRKDVEPKDEDVDPNELKEIEVTEAIIPIFYEVVNNEYIVNDTKKNAREMKVSSRFLTGKGTHIADYVFRADCQNEMAALIKIGSGNTELKPIGMPTSLTGVAFNRICGGHLGYMKQVKKYSN